MFSSLTSYLVSVSNVRFLCYACFENTFGQHRDHNMVYAKIKLSSHNLLKELNKAT